jgi:hypothetical protein
LLAVSIADLGVGSFDDLFVEAVHVLGAEGRLEGGHFVDDAAKRPNI